jgi:hydroxyacylglutathione hydrolase
MISVTALPAFSDNYVWLLRCGREAVVVDPGDAGVVERFVADNGLHLAAILVTHHHPDHVGGVAQLAQAGLRVYGPRGEAEAIPALTDPLDDGDRIVVDALASEFQIISIPGHTRGHIAFWAPGQLFCGDTLFSAGCGRLFEGTAQQMYHSLGRLAALPEDTLVYCAHEYTLSNLAFAREVEPNNPAVHHAIDEVRAQRAAQQPSVPSSIARERRFNPFLRCEEDAIRVSAERWSGSQLDTPEAVFAQIRRWKDSFRPPTPL